MIDEIIKNKVLLIDDDEMINQVLTSILEQEFEVENYFTAEDVLGKVEFSDFDVILTDVNLPGISGIDFLSKVREVDPNLPVIVITGMTYIDVAISALKNGATDFIQKPFYNDQIIIAVKRAQERRRLVLQNILLVDELKEKNQQLEVLNKNIQFRNEQMEHDLDIASNLQACLFPTSTPEVKDFSFALKYKPIEKISGDFFDLIENKDGSYILIFADISGHGVPAALYSAMVKAAISSLDSSVKSPAKQIYEINQFLLHSQKKLSYNYATLCYIYFDLNNKKIIYSNAGIPAPILIRKNGKIDSLKQNGPFVGIFESVEFQDVELPFGKGDKIILFTDGAYEGYSEKDVLTGYKVTYEMVESIKKKSIDDIVNKLYSKIESAEKENEDDITIMGIKYK